MSHGPAGYTSEDIKKISEAEPFQVSKPVKLCMYLLVLLGALSLFSLVIGGDASRKQAWMSLHVNFMFWFGLAAASSGFAAVFHICNAQWARPVRRIFESAFPFFTVSPFFILILYFGGESVFSWAVEPVHGKEFWLSQGFLYMRDFIAALLLVWVIGVVVKGSVSLDITALRAGLAGSKKDRWSSAQYAKYELPGDAKSAIQKMYDRMGRFSPACVIVYALAMSLLAFDLLMSVDPHWYSTMFGGFYFMSAVYLAVAFAAIGVSVVRSQNSLYATALKRKTLHDLGKLLFGFGIFWAYLFWSHYLPIWYGNLPEETGYIILRLREYPWRNLAWTVLGLCFIVPFAMGISRDLKQVPQLLSATGVFVAVGLWLQYYLLFLPSLSPTLISISIQDAGIGLGFLGIYALSAFSYLSKVPLLPFGDLIIKK